MVSVGCAQGFRAICATHLYRPRMPRLPIESSWRAAHTLSGGCELVLTCAARGPFHGVDRLRWIQMDCTRHAKIGRETVHVSVGSVRERCASGG